MEFTGTESFNLGSGFSSYNDPDMINDDELGVCSDSSSSVGCRSESSDDEELSCIEEPLENRNAKQQVVPPRRGISKFYSGKSKSFTSLADAVCSASVKEFAKPETYYSKKQINPLARNIPDSKQVSSLRSNPGGHFKKFIPISYGNVSCLDEPCSSSASPPICLPPLHPQTRKPPNPDSSVLSPRQKCSPWRSFSVSDLQGMVHNA